MMILVLLGSTHATQLKLVAELDEGLKGQFLVSHIDNDPELVDQDKKYANLARLTTSRVGRDTVTVVTGVSSLPEYDILNRHRAVFCVLPGTLCRLLARGDVAISPDFVYVASKSVKLGTEAKRRVFGSILHAFSECYSRELNANRRA